VRVKATIEYDGAAFAGWQIQPSEPTVQAALEHALLVVTGDRCSVTGAGRTDAGVHATGQVAAFDVSDDTDLYRLRASLNGLTPPEISVVDLEPVSERFDPRRDARARRYRYTIVHGRPPAPLLRDRSWHVYPRLDLQVLRHLAEAVVGTHDFHAFRASDCEAESSVRTVYSSSWSDEAGVLTYEICANAFLKQMVRVLVGSMVEVALGKLDEATFVRLLEAGDRTEAGRTAPAQGLVLVEVSY